MGRRTDAISGKLVAELAVGMLRVFAYLLVHREYDRTFRYEESYEGDRVTITLSADRRVFFQLHRLITHAIAERPRPRQHIEQQMRQPEAG
ncbi:MAG: hypothetical protein AB7I38_18640 [Dehalococcoidia bacterium]